ncbi:hypothetical protein EKN76_14090 [Enterobacter bugandensis]|uniref:hypothetical protein n=1 Tax=Enterobacter roggenkampii TaxID=1812935 RepID=UPI000907F37C|nr:hypothetical protein [Enterobacter roggenkampii]MDZ5727780.1 hypothetical protein [Enterobacter sp. D2]PJD10590.1 hypothetical protein B9Q19_08660 [Enterobacter bugandensis]DAI69978.1 MAG TPA: Cold-shock DNA-binding domain protein [Caudoviricetes sp.]RTM26494.1 hypothetical protein EKO14_22080 [Enterobacter bugandensis]RTO13460.1 hypothetical protein EKN76_14090 [Enterobacter bugandensis]
MLKFSSLEGRLVEQKEELPNKGYAVIRCNDGVIVARLHSFPDSGRALMYRRGDEVSFMPLQDDEIVGTPTLFTQMLERAGYRVSKNSVTLPS